MKIENWMKRKAQNGSLSYDETTQKAMNIVLEMALWEIKQWLSLWHDHRHLNALLDFNEIFGRRDWVILVNIKGPVSGIFCEDRIEADGKDLSTLKIKNRKKI